MRFYRLSETLKIGWQAPGGNVGLGRLGAPPKWTSLQEDTGRESIVPWASTVRGQEDCLVREENQEFLTASEDRKKFILQNHLIFIRQVINVYTLDLNSRRPVMIFIHGGGFFAGQSINKSTNIPDHRQSKTVRYCQAGRDKLLARLAT